MRKLASIQRILSLEPIEGADRIEKATIEGWTVVVEKGLHVVGDLIVFCEIDSILPERPEFEFLRNKNFRIKTIRLRGCISQGLCLPLSVLPPVSIVTALDATTVEMEELRDKIERSMKKHEVSIITNYEIDWEDATVQTYTEGMDVTEILGITKYDPPIPACLGGTVKGNFPSFMPKTDETRVQVLQSVLTEFKNTPCFISEKMDGSSVSFYVRDGEFGVCSRNLELKETEGNTAWRLARSLDLENKLKTVGFNIALQGELIGEGVQGNKYGLKGQKVLFFNAFDIDSYAYISFQQFSNLIRELNLESVPILSTDYSLSDSIPELVELSRGKSVLNPKINREGIVIRPLVEGVTILEGLGRVSFKSINPDFLLRYEE